MGAGFGDLFFLCFRVGRSLLHFRPFASNPPCHAQLCLHFFFWWPGRPAAIAGQPQKAMKLLLQSRKLSHPVGGGTTPDVMLLLSGHDLEATHVPAIFRR